MVELSAVNGVVASSSLAPGAIERYSMNFKGTKDKTFICKSCNSVFGFKGYSSNHKFCSIRCFNEHTKENQTKLLEDRYIKWLSGEDLGIQNSRPVIKQFVERRDGRKCAICKRKTWNKKPITLWCDHIDGNASNNHPDNFRLVCPNCDSQNDTFGAKNYGNGRKSRGMHQYG